MRRPILILALALATAGGVPASASDDQMKPALMWNPATVATISGTVQAVERVEMGESWRCVRLRILTADGEVQVRVGPDWYVSARKLAFATGDKLEVKGSRLTFAGEKAMVAGEIVRGSERIVLRDEAGKPAWGGQ